MGLVRPLVAAGLERNWVAFEASALGHPGPQGTGLCAWAVLPGSLPSASRMGSAHADGEMEEKAQVLPMTLSLATLPWAPVNPPVSRARPLRLHTLYNTQF